MAAVANPVIIMKPRSSIARLLRVGESLPADLKVEFTRIDPLWVWVIDDHGGNGIEACLIAAPGPGIAILLKIASIPSSSPAVIVKLLRKSLTDISHRGYHAYMVCLDTDKLMEKKLARVVIKSGGLVMGKGVIMVGSTDIGGL
jgi:hypothetical protein